MPAHVFAVLAVRDFGGALPWYERLLGEVSFFAHDREAVWTVGEGSVAVHEDAERAGGGEVTVFLEDLDGWLGVQELEPDRGGDVLEWGAEGGIPGCGWQ